MQLALIAIAVLLVGAALATSSKASDTVEFEHFEKNITVEVTEGAIVRVTSQFIIAPITVVITSTGDSTFNQVLGEFIPVNRPTAQTNVFELPKELPSGEYRISANSRQGSGSVIFTMEDGLFEEAPSSDVSYIPFSNDGGWLF